MLEHHPILFTIILFIGLASMFHIVKRIIEHKPQKTFYFVHLERKSDGQQVIDGFCTDKPFISDIFAEANEIFGSQYRLKAIETTDCIIYQSKKGGENSWQK